MPGIASVEMTEKWRAVHTLAVEIRLTDDGGQMTDDGGQTTEDRRRTMDDGEVFLKSKWCEIRSLPSDPQINLGAKQARNKLRG